MVGGLLIRLGEHQRFFPFPLRPDLRAGKPLLVSDRPGHRLARRGRIGEDFLLPRARCERLPLLDPQRLEHPHHDPIALVDRLLIDDPRQFLPVGKPAGLRAAPCSPGGGNMARGTRVVALCIGIHPQPFDERSGLGRIGVKDTVGREDIHRRGAEYEVTVGLHLGVVGAEDQILPPSSLVGAGLPGIGDRSLPEVGAAPCRRPGRDLEDERPRFLQIREGHDVGGSGVGGEEAELVLEREVVDIVELPCAELRRMLALPLHHRHQGEGPEIGLAGPLEVEVVEELLDGGRGGIAMIELECAEPRCHAAGGGEMSVRCQGSVLVESHGDRAGASRGPGWPGRGDRLEKVYVPPLGSLHPSASLAG